MTSSRKTSSRKTSSRKTSSHKTSSRKKTFFARLTESSLFVTSAALCLRFFLALLNTTFRFRYEGLDELHAFCKTHKGAKLIFSLWHNRIFLLAPIIIKAFPHFSYSVLMSKSRDGAIPAAFTNSFKQAEAIRSGHMSRHGALSDLIKALEKKRMVIITPDGPRGPRYEVKPGIVFLAQKTDAYIVPFSWQASKEKKLSSWDEFRIPLPFSTIQVRFGTPFQIKDLPADAALERIKTAMNQ